MSKNNIVLRQEKQLLSFINEFLAEEVTHASIKTISVIDVDLNEDYSTVIFYYDAENPGKELEEALESIKNFTKKRIAESVDLRKVPVPEFRFDTENERARGVDKILDKLNEEKN